MVTAAFSLRLRGLRESHRMGTSRSMTGATKGSNCVAVTKSRQGQSILGVETASSSALTILSKLQSDLPDRPGSVVADADLGVRGIGKNLLDNDRHDLGDVRVDQGESGNSDISQEGQGRLSNAILRVLFDGGESSSINIVPCHGTECQFDSRANNST